MVYFLVYIAISIGESQGKAGVLLVANGLDQKPVAKIVGIMVVNIMEHCYPRMALTTI